MVPINYWAVVTAALASMVIGLVWFGLLGSLVMSYVLANRWRSLFLTSKGTAFQPD